MCTDERARTRASPLSLLQEELREEPWKLLVACILLNRTSFKQVRKVIWKLFDDYATVTDLAHADETSLRMMLKPLGFSKNRAMTLRRFATEFITKDWHDPIELYGIGKYGSDSYRIFVQNNIIDAEPSDKKLIAYKAWALGETDDPEELLRQA